MRVSSLTPRLSIRKWAWWQLPTLLRCWVALVPLVALALTGIAAVRTTWHGADLVAYALLLTGGAVSVATTPRSAYVDGRLSMDFIPVWVLPVAVVLPPVYALSMPYPLYAVTQWRVHRGPLHRKVFSAASIAIGYGAASLVFHSLPAGIAGPHIGLGIHALTWALAVVGCETFVARWHNVFLMAAIKLSDPKAKVVGLALSRESLLSNLAESDLGVLISCVVAASPWLSLFAVPTIILARRFMMHSQLVAQTRVDAKTGLLNSAAWEREAGVEVQRALRTGSALSVVLVDIDHFKDVNDTHGHLVGDVVLRAVTDEIQGNLRIYDLAGRFGGEEFVVLLPHAGEGDAVRIAERLRVQIASLATPIAPGATPVPVSRPIPDATATVPPAVPAESAVASPSGQLARPPGGVNVPSTTPRCGERHIHPTDTAAVAAGTRPDAAVPVPARGSATPASGVPDEPVVRVTVSIGVAAMDAVRRDLGALMAAADAALYEAKQSGRNRTRVMPSVAGPAADMAAPVRAPQAAVAARR